VLDEGESRAGRSDAPSHLRARGITRHFGSTAVLDDVDLDLGSGELVALVGGNGAGKSTLIACLARSLATNAGEVVLDGRPLDGTAATVQARGVSVVWQDLALCDNLDAVANLFLGRERRSVLLAEGDMYAEAHRLLLSLGIDLPDLYRPVSSLSGGQRQLIAIARAVLDRPRFLLLDEPTAALGVKETRLVDGLLRRLRHSGIAMLLVSHRMEQVFDLADRIVVLRHGRVVANVSPLEVHPDDVVDLMAGVRTESTARKQLHRLRSLVDQLSEVEPSASLPLIVSAIATALDQQQVCVHLLDTVDEAGSVELVRRAAVGLPAPLLEVTHRLVPGPAGGPVGDAAAHGRYVVVDDLRGREGSSELARAARRSGVVSAWAVPILGTAGVLGVISGWSPTPGRLQPEQLELVSLYAGHAAGAIEREQLLDEVSRRNRILETLRGVLETLAGPEQLRGGLEIALLALARGLGADSVALYVDLGAGIDCRARVDLDPDLPIDDAAEVTLPAADNSGGGAEGALLAGARSVLDGPGLVDRARPFGGDVVAAPLGLPEGRGALAAWWSDPSVITGDTLDLLDDAARSVRLAIEREGLDAANQEAEGLRRSRDHQRAFLSRISHELRTPLTAIRGYASSLNQTDVSWDDAAQHHFLDLIGAESARMGRLVGDLLDSSALDSGVLTLQSDWCDLGLIIDAAAACVPSGTDAVKVSVDPRVGPVWGDHDRLEQVFVNLLENAARHGDGLAGISVEVAPGTPEGMVDIRVSDHGPGIPAELVGSVFQPQVRGTTMASGAGLGLAIARGIVETHGGTITVEPSLVGATLLVTLAIEPPDA
jgi:signal transduction histidine kinase/ABC-type branched-subunit amino acid transport system ATPase component/GAF domain-containing protein